MKKGQLTLFIIIGILVLLSIVLVVYLRSSASVSEIRDVVKPTTQQVPFEVQAIHDFVETCVQQISKDGLQKLGDQGGFIQSSFRTNPLESTEGDGVILAPGGNTVVPYWFYLKSDNDCEGNCEFSTQRPALYATVGQVSIEDQLNTYVKTHLPTCLNEFASFKDEYDITPQGDISVRTQIGGQVVYVHVDYELDVKRGSATHQLKDYLATLDVNLGQIYQLATDITNMQGEGRFLEQYSRNLIDGFSDLDEHAIPPVSGFVIDFGPGIFWVKDNVMGKLSQILYSYVPLLQVHGARNYKFIESPDDQGINDPELYQILYNRGALIPVNNTPRSLDVRFSYLDWWKPYIDLNCKGQICQSQSVSNTYGFVFGMQQYNFAYDLSYPVLVEISNPDALNREGYSFKFFLESNMRDNQPLKATYRPLRAVELPVGTQLCDIDKRYSGAINVTVVNGKTNRLMDTTYLTFNCGDESCAFNPLYGGSDSLRMPLCVGGTLGTTAQGFHPTYVPLDTFYNQSNSVRLDIEPIRHVDVSIKNYVLRKSASTWELDTSNLVGQESDEQVAIQLERIGTVYDEPFSSFASIKGDVFSKETQYRSKIPLIPGRYKVTISGLKYAQPPITIPSRTTEVSTGPFSSAQQVNLPAIEFNSTNPLPVVGVEFEWDVTKEDLDHHKNIEFHGLKLGLDKVPESDREIDDLQQLGKVDDYYKAYPTLLLPEWTNE